jgi:CheY-like chemotaxis protein
MGFDDIDVMNVPGHVLIVEDDADTREMLVTLLGDEGFHAVAAEDGLEALHLLRTVRHQRPETQLADPVVASVPVAVMSGAVDAQELSRSLGAVATLPKPLDITFLLQVVRQHCTIQPQP